MDQRRAVSEVAAIFDGVVRDVDPESLVHGALRLSGDAILVRDTTIPLAANARLVVVAIGKAAIPMARGAEAALGDRIDRGIAVTKRGATGSSPGLLRIRLLEAGHPVPDASSEVAGTEVLAAVEGLNPGDLVLMLISGGGSALVEAPVAGVSLADIARVTDELLRAGADIQALNAVRRRLSRIKAGGLARAIAPARIVNLIISDVLGNPLPVIASGPTVDPGSGGADPAAITRQLGVWEHLPAHVQRAISGAGAGEAERPLAPILTTVILADADAAARAAERAASGAGYRAVVLGTRFTGEAREFARFWSALARHVATCNEPFQRPVCLIGAGELTVTVRGSGSGGRNTEMCLAAALEIAGLQGVAVASLATDGDDGTTGAAGGVVVGDSVERARARGLDPVALLESNDSRPFLEACGGLLVTGPTGTNVNDIYLALIP